MYDSGTIINSDSVEFPGTLLFSGFEFNGFKYNGFGWSFGVNMRVWGVAWVIVSTASSGTDARTRRNIVSKLYNPAVTMRQKLQC